jgi:hypothetical protein
MLISEKAKAFESAWKNCDNCGNDAVITMHGYGDSENGECNWCADCAMQLVRKIMEDLCELLTKGGRHG